MEAFSEKISIQGKSLPAVKAQIDRFAKGFPYLSIVRPAQATDGIKVLSTDQISRLGKDFLAQRDRLAMVKFVPASGAASRMFKKLFEFLDGDGYLAHNQEAETFIKHLRNFPFYEDLEQSLGKVGSYAGLALQDKDFKLIISQFLLDSGLGYVNLPKGLVKFHRYDDHERTPVHEHFVEGLQYGVGKDRKVHLHFTVSNEHLEAFNAECNRVKAVLEKEHDITFEVSFSQQKASTDTIAVNVDNTPFLKDDGTLLFRPGGHGALLSNLEDIDGDVIFIKNIDNVAGERGGKVSSEYKMAMGGLLLNLQQQVFDYLDALEEGEEGVEAAIEEFLQQELCVVLPKAYWGSALMERRSFLKSKLERPIRICGMVRNTGEPGGGPFWTQNHDGSISLQIAEKAQIDPKHQEALLMESTHFNPVDLVCSIKRRDGRNFSLPQFADSDAGLISEKSLNGKALKALELPGLWNGGMSDWNTIFVEVPLETFTPVKTINDLLREAHQPMVKMEK
ncbi:DUF4301 family protein [Echinicola vietnamensis]|uniref:DUF4301 domain-containing protein n=1 Tax=Echinicola vietnamensis (strain DSM 17526 / LMG 23754 / KMM 6221) TaxID=926556 RepID=L0G3C8_ECHVK|nr:DUF4301 family protein [Echinicola vietnamensis]AGA79997.1 hypothetical protein Echvi_3785 [Echinicola vietnamensis DSM 17526]